MLSDARTAVQLMQGMQVHAEVALVQPILPASPADDKLFKNDYRSFVGWYKVLERLHQTVDVVTLREIDVGQVPLNQYAWILVPDCAYLTEAAWQRLADYVKAGGRLVTTRAVRAVRRNRPDPRCDGETPAPPDAPGLRPRLRRRPDPRHARRQHTATVPLAQ